MKDRPLTAEERAFYDDSKWVDLLTDDDRRRNRDSGVREALYALIGPFGGAIGHASRIREQTEEDHRIAAVMTQVRVLLDGIATPEPKPGRPRRRR